MPIGLTISAFSWPTGSRPIRKGDGRIFLSSIAGTGGTHSGAIVLGWIGDLEIAIQGDPNIGPAVGLWMEFTATTETITDPAGRFLEYCFEPGMIIEVTGSGSNDGFYRVKALIQIKPDGLAAWLAVKTEIVPEGNRSQSHYAFRVSDLKNGYLAIPGKISASAACGEDMAIKVVRNLGSEEFTSPIREFAELRQRECLSSRYRETPTRGFGMARLPGRNGRLPPA